MKAEHICKVGFRFVFLGERSEDKPLSFFSVIIRTDFIQD